MAPSIPSPSSHRGSKRLSSLQRRRRSSLESNKSLLSFSKSKREQQPKDDVIDLQQSASEKAGSSNGSQDVLVESYPCVFRDTKGTLFASSEGIVFVGRPRVALVPKRVQLDWHDIAEIVNDSSNMSNTSKDRSISFITNRNKTKQFEFTSEDTSQSERVIETLLSLHEQSRHDTTCDDDSSTSTCSASSVSSEAHHKFIETANDSREWKDFQMRSAKSTAFATPAIQDEVLPCSLDTFFDMFVADTATCSFQSLHEKTGDVNVTVTPWTLENDSAFDTSSSASPPCMIRTIEYQHNVNLSFAPPLALVRKQQRYRRYGPYGLSLETDTYIHDVPLSKYFYVSDRVLIEPSSDGTNAVTIEASLDVHFVKKIMFQSLITTETGRKHAQSLVELNDYWSQALAVTSSSSSVSPLPSQPSNASMGELLPPINPVKDITPLNEVSNNSVDSTSTSLMQLEEQSSKKDRRTRVIIFTVVNMKSRHVAISFIGLFFFLLVASGYGNSALDALSAATSFC